MCRFVALFARNAIEINPYFEFLKTQAKNGMRGPHPDGYGIWIKNDTDEYLFKSTVPVWEANLELPRGKIAFLHARKRGKTGAAVNLLNLHPFIYKDSVFMHNGIIHIPEHPKAHGHTDTESLFFYLIDGDLEKDLKYIAKNYPFKSINFVMYKKNSLYILRLARELENYFTIHIKNDEDKIIISTEKDSTSWWEVKNGELITIYPDFQIDRYCVFQDMCH